jgi:hypothetical protein
LVASTIPFTALAERGAEKLLRLAVTAIDVGSIEEGDAEPDRLVDDAPRPLEIDTPAEIVAAEADKRDFEAGPAKGAVLHRVCRMVWVEMRNLSGQSAIGNWQ